MITKPEFLKEMAFISKEDINFNLELFFIFEDDNTSKGEDIFKAILVEDIASSLKNMFLSEIRKKINVQDLQLLNYDPLNAPDTEYLWTLPSNSVQNFSLLSRITSRSCMDCNEFKNYDNLKSVIVKIDIKESNNPIFIFKRVFKAKNISKGKSIFYKNGAFEKIDQKVISIDEKFDAFLLKENYYINHARNFEFITEYCDERLSAAKEEFKKIEAKNFIDIQEFDIEKLFEDSNIINKLNNIADERIYEKLSFLELENHNSKSGCELNIQSNKFVIRSKSEFKSFLKLINDDFLESTLSKYQYESRNKIKKL